MPPFHWNNEFGYIPLVVCGVQPSSLSEISKKRARSQPFFVTVEILVIRHNKTFGCVSWQP
jgi:hypothetical protein